MAVTTRPLAGSGDGKQGQRRCSVCGKPKTAYALAKGHQDRLIDPPICLGCRDAQRAAERAARDTAIDAEFPPAVCGLCGEEKPASAFPTHHGRPTTGACLACKSKLNRGLDFGWRTVRDAPSPEPARQLRHLLAEARRQGHDFSDMWGPLTDQVLATIRNREDRQQWHMAFAMTSDAWGAAYRRIKPRRAHQETRLSMDLLDDAA